MVEIGDTLIWFLIGIVLTVIGSATVAWATEQLKYNFNRRKLFKALYKEIKDNLERVDEILELKRLLEEREFRYVSLDELRAELGIDNR